MQSRRLERAGAVAAVVLVLAPLIAALVTHVGRDWLPIHDVAVTDMRVRDVWSADTPLVGPYSRYLWNHPGPLMFWMMAVPSALSGQAAWGTLVGGVLVQAVAVVWAAVLAWRVGRLPIVLLTMATVLLTFRAVGPLVILEPWNPHVALPWFVLFVLYAWRLALGELRRLPGAVFVASFLLQTHVGYLPLVASASAVALVYLVLDHRRARLERVGWRPFAWSAGIAAVVWAPVVIEQVTGSPGNLTRLWDYFFGGENVEPVAGGRAALGLAGGAFTLPPPWLGGEEVRNLLTNTIQPRGPWLIVIPLALLALGVIGATRARRREHLRYVVLIAAVFAAGVFALSRITGDLLEYLFYWRVPLACMVLVAAGVGLADLVSSSARAGSTSPSTRAGSTSPSTRPQASSAAPATIAAVAGAVGLAALVALSAASTAAVATHGSRVKPFEREVAAILDQIDVEQIDGPVIVRFDGSTLGGLQGGLVDALDRDGVAVRVDDSLGFQFGEHRAATTEEVDEIWYALEDGWLTSLRTSDPRGRVVAQILPLGPETEAEMVRLQLALYDQLREAGRLDLAAFLDTDLVAFVLDGVDGVDATTAARLGELNAEVRALGSCRCAVVAFAPEDAPTPPPG